MRKYTEQNSAELRIYLFIYLISMTHGVAMQT